MYKEKLEKKLSCGSSTMVWKLW